MIPVCALRYSDVFLNRDQKHRGRCIVALKEHKTEYFQLTPEENAGYFEELSRVAKAIWELYHSDHARYCIPRLSTVEIHIPWMAKAALRNLMDQIVYGERYPMKILIPATLTLYDSVRDLQAP